MVSYLICLVSVFLLNQISVTQPRTENTSPESMKCNMKNIKLLQQSLTKDVLSVWPLKERFSTLRDLYLDKNNFWSAIKHENNERLERIAEKVLHGMTVNVAVYGGSNTAGGGLQEDEKSIKGRFPILLQGWWDNVITPVTGSRLNITIIGIGGTSSRYYEYCYNVYLDINNIDLVILESSVNDGVAIKLGNLTNSNYSLPLEQFTRQLLNEPNNLALMFVNFFLTVRRQSGCFNLVDLGQSLVSSHYNITTFNLRNVACDFKSGKFHITAKALKHQSEDRYHMSLLGHAQAAFMIIQVIKKSIKRLLNDRQMLIRNKTIYDCNVPLHVSKCHPLPPPKYIKPTSSIINNPLCWTGLTSDKDNMIRNTLKVSILKTKGFSYTKHISIVSPKYHGKIVRTDCFSCWLGMKKDSEITFSFEVRHVSSANVITRSSLDSGELEVWLDKDMERRVKLYPQTVNRQTVVATVAKEMTPGNHTLTVRITKHGKVHILGIALSE